MTKKNTIRYSPEKRKDFARLFLDGIENGKSVRDLANQLGPRRETLWKFVKQYYPEEYVEQVNAGVVSPLKNKLKKEEKRITQEYERKEKKPEMITFPLNTNEKDNRVTAFVILGNMKEVSRILSSFIRNEN